MNTPSKSFPHSIQQNIHYVLTNFATVAEHYRLKLAGYYLFSLSLTVLTTIFPAVIVDQFERRTDARILILTIIAFSISLGLLAYTAAIVKFQGDATITRGRFKSFELQLYRKLLKTDYENTLTNRFEKLLVNALTYGVYGDGSGVSMLLRHFANFGLSSLLIVGFSIYATVKVPIFLPLIIIELTLTYFVNKIDTNYRQRTLTQRDNLYNQQNYLTRTASNIKNGKEIRLFALAPWFNQNLEQSIQASKKYEQSLANHTFAARFWDVLFGFVRDTLVFIILLRLIYQQQLSLASFVLYFNILAQMSAWTRQLIQQYSDLKKSSQDIDHLRQFMDFPETPHQTNAPALKTKDLTIRFDHVSYRYPQAGKDTLIDVSFEIPAGTSLALVGNNGAGKSTIVQLLLGLLRPTTGTIYFNDVPTDQFTQEAISHYLTPVFQSTDVWALTIAQTVAMGFKPAEIDESRVNSALQQVGLLAKITRLPAGIHTELTHYLSTDGIELSGGETQRLMLARALYRQTPAILLDEPTAALDALAESELYEEYQQLIGHKTSLFISHRLASTRFCDSIILLAGGKIIEQGTHDELMRQPGAYRQMYQVQSQYYTTTGGATNEESINPD